MSFSSESVPFVDLGRGRVGLTDAQLCEHQELAAFVKRFSNMFGYDPVIRAWIFNDPRPGAVKVVPVSRTKGLEVDL